MLDDRRLVTLCQQLEQVKRSQGPDSGARLILIQQELHLNKDAPLPIRTATQYLERAIRNLTTTPIDSRGWDDINEAEKLLRSQLPKRTKPSLLKRLSRSILFPLALTSTAAPSAPMHITPTLPTVEVVAPARVAPTIVGNEKFSLTQQRIHEHRSYIHTLSQEVGVNEALILGIVTQESEGDAKVTSGAGAIGLMQMMPGTARWFKVSRSDLFNPQVNLRTGTKYLRDLLVYYQGYDAQVELALAAYNGGMGNVDKAISRARPDKSTRQTISWEEVSANLPTTMDRKQTRDYVPAVLKYAHLWQQQLGK
jgi:soluble lytic murein transglycosylase-like protein